MTVILHRIMPYDAQMIVIIFIMMTIVIIGIMKMIIINVIILMMIMNSIVTMMQILMMIIIIVRCIASIVTLDRIAKIPSYTPLPLALLPLSHAHTHLTFSSLQALLLFPVRQRLPSLL